MSVGQDVTIGYGVRVRESIILGNCVLQVCTKVNEQYSSIKNICSLKDHCCVLYSIIAWNSTIGPWSRVEGTPNGKCRTKRNDPIESQGIS